MKNPESVTRPGVISTFPEKRFELLRLGLLLALGRGIRLLALLGLLLLLGIARRSRILGASNGPRGGQQDGEGDEDDAGELHGVSPVWVWIVSDPARPLCTAYATAARRPPEFMGLELLRNFVCAVQARTRLWQKC